MSAGRLAAVVEHAFGLARQGHWKLADALELQARAREDKTIAGIAHQVGSEALVGYLSEAGDFTTEVECHDCLGDGETDCCECGQSRACPTCDGEGVVDRDMSELHAGTCVRWETLGGEPRELDGESIRFGAFMSVEDARRIAFEWGRLASALAAKPYPTARQAAVLDLLQVAA